MCTAIQYICHVYKLLNIYIIQYCILYYIEYNTVYVFIYYMISAFVLGPCIGADPTIGVTADTGWTRLTNCLVSTKRRQ